MNLENFYSHGVDLLCKDQDAIINSLEKHEALVLDRALRRAQDDWDMYHIFEWLKNPRKWRRPKVGIKTFIESEYYLGLGDTIYPKIMEVLTEIVTGGYSEGIVVGGLGSGKSFLSQILGCYNAHHLLCLNNPHKVYGIEKDKNITILNMGISATQAWEVVFSGITSFIQKSPFFQEYVPDIIQTRITFHNEKVALVSGNSQSKKALGQNVFAAILDEASFYLNNKDRNVAEEIYHALQRRIVSRFGHHGFIIAITSPLYEEDFAMTKLKEARELDENGNRVYPSVFSIQLPTWKFKPLYKADMTNKFYFHVERNQILTEPIDEIEETYQVNHVEDGDFHDQYEVWEIPGEYKRDFRANPDTAKRDFGALPSYVLQPFLGDSDAVNKAFTKDDVVKAPGHYVFPERPLRTNYFIHIDIGLNVEGKSDATGFAMGHCGGWFVDEITGESRMIYDIDLVERIECDKKTKEVDLEGIRQRIYTLTRMGYHIKLITLDRYASRDTVQILRKKGYRADFLSVDRSIEPYNILKEGIYEERCYMPNVNILRRELLRLELIDGIKVDHVKNFSKDCSDAVAGVVFNIQEHTPANTMGVGTGASFDNVEGNLSLSHEEKSKREEQAIQWKKEMAQLEDDIINDNF